MRIYHHGKNKFYYRNPFYRSRGFYFFLIIILLFGWFINWSIVRASKTKEILIEKTNEQTIKHLAKIIFESGKIQIKKSSTDNWQEYLPGMELFEKSSIKTAENSKAIIEFFDGSQARLNQNAEIFLETINDSDIILLQKSGQSYHRLKKNSTLIYKVKNNQTEITTLGTAFDVLSSGELTQATAIHHNLKVKIYHGETLANLRTVEQGQQANINGQLPLDEMIKTIEKSSTSLLENDWFVFNLHLDKELSSELGILGDVLNLKLTEPTTTEITTTENKILISGETTLTAKIYSLGRELNNNQGNFSEEFFLIPGENKIEITAIDGDKKNKLIVNVFYDKELEQIKLQGKVENNKVVLTWKVPETENYSLFRLFYQAEKTPNILETNYQELLGNLNSWSIENLPNGNYFFILCPVKENSCFSQSNVLSLEIKTSSPSEQPPIETPTNQIILSGNFFNDKINLEWQTTNNNLNNGFFSFIAENEDDLFPGINHHFLPSAETNHDFFVPPQLGKNYYLTVCENANGVCGKKSNTITIFVPENN